jgi:hypothetical protein
MDECRCFTERDLLVALVRTVADLRDLTGVMLFLGAEVRDGWRRASPRQLSELLIQAHRLRADATRLVERFQEGDEP